MAEAQTQRPRRIKRQKHGIDVRKTTLTLGRQEMAELKSQADARGESVALFIAEHLRKCGVVTRTHGRDCEDGA